MNEDHEDSEINILGTFSNIYLGDNTKLPNIFYIKHFKLWMLIFSFT